MRAKKVDWKWTNHSAIFCRAFFSSAEFDCVPVALAWTKNYHNISLGEVNENGAQHCSIWNWLGAKSIFAQYISWNKFIGNGRHSSYTTHWQLWFHSEIIQFPVRCWFYYPNTFQFPFKGTLLSKSKSFKAYFAEEVLFPAIDAIASTLLSLILTRCLSCQSSLEWRTWNDCLSCGKCKRTNKQGSCLKADVKYRHVLTALRNVIYYSFSIWEMRAARWMMNLCATKWGFPLQFLSWRRCLKKQTLRIGSATLLASSKRPLLE